MSKAGIRLQLLLSILPPLALLTFAHLLDYVRHRFTHTGLVDFSRTGIDWSILILLNLLFAAGIFLYVWDVLTAVQRQPAASIASLALCGIVFLYGSFFFTGLLPDVLRFEMPQTLARLLGILTNLHPRSFFMLSTATLTVGAVVGLARYARARRSA